jgi:RND family efflux transporter MFP subunit
LKPLAVFVCLVALLAGCRDKENSDAWKPEAEAKQSEPADDSPGVTLRKEAQVRAALKVETLDARAVRPELVAYGQLQEDPNESFVVRAPYAGTLRATEGRDWPALGQSIAAGTEFGRIEPRLAVTDRIGLNTQLATAKADLSASLAAVAAARTAYDRAVALNADNKNVSDKVVQEAAARLAAEKAHEAAARASAEVLEKALGSPVGAAVIAQRGGEVAEILAQPGESIEQGSPVMRLAHFDRLLVRIDLPAGERVPANERSVRITPVGFEDRAPLLAERVGVAAAADTHMQGLSLLYRLTRTIPGIRPGLAVTARFELPGAAGGGVFIPRSAVVQQDGRLWVYVQTKDDRFSRRPVPTDMPAQNGFLVSRGFDPGERIVVVGAQSLLSEEYKSRNEADTN